MSATSTIMFPSSGTTTISFARSTASGWVGTLFIDNWVNGDSLDFGANQNGLGTGAGPDFTSIVFVNPNGLVGDYTAQISSSGVVTAIPEVGSFPPAALLSALLGWRERRRIRAALFGPRRRL